MNIRTSLLLLALTAPLAAQMQPEPQQQQARIIGKKFYDINENGFRDPDDPRIGGWRIELLEPDNPDPVQVVFTVADGFYCFLVPLDGRPYIVREVAPDPGFIPEPGAIWLNTSPIEARVSANAETVVGPNFSNLSFELLEGAGRTPEFWCTDEGRELLKECDPEWRTALNELCLRSAFKPFGFVRFSEDLSFDKAYCKLCHYLKSCDFGNAGQQLSVQIAATVLNVTCGFLDGNIWVDARQDGVLVRLSDLIAEANKNLLCQKFAGLAYKWLFPRLYHQIVACLGEFGSINGSGDANNVQVVYKSSETPVEFESPYGSGFGGGDGD